MKLTKDHIGKKVKLEAWDSYGEFCGFKGDHKVIFKDDCFQVWDTDEGWYIEKPTLKPSERIANMLVPVMDIVNQMNILNFKKEESIAYAHKRIDAIIKYLDEQAQNPKSS